MPQWKDFAFLARPGLRLHDALLLLLLRRKKPHMPCSSPRPALPRSFVLFLRAHQAPAWCGATTALTTQPLVANGGTTAYSLCNDGSMAWSFPLACCSQGSSHGLAHDFSFSISRQVKGHESDAWGSGRAPHLQMLYALSFSLHKVRARIRVRATGKPRYTHRGHEKKESSGTDAYESSVQASNPCRTMWTA